MARRNLTTFALIFNFASLLLLSWDAKTRRSERRCLELRRAEMLIVRWLAMDDGGEDRGKAEYAIAVNMLLSPRVAFVGVFLTETKRAHR